MQFRQCGDHGAERGGLKLDGDEMRPVQEGLRTGALSRRGGKGIGAEFIERHEAFLASGCLSKADVCPRSPEEFELARRADDLAMNAGTASTFLPFACGK